MLPRSFSQLQRTVRESPGEWLEGGKKGRPCNVCRDEGGIARVERKGCI